MPGITITAAIAVRRSSLHLLCDYWRGPMRPSFHITHTGRQPQGLLLSCHGLRLSITLIPPPVVATLWRYPTWLPHVGAVIAAKVTFGWMRSAGRWWSLLTQPGWA